MGLGDSQEYMDLDLSTVALQDLLHEINPNFLGDLREGAPDLLRALMKQEPTQLDMPAQSRTEELGRAAAFIDDSGGTDESGLHSARMFHKAFRAPSLTKQDRGKFLHTQWRCMGLFCVVVLLLCLGGVCQASSLCIHPARMKK